jgi:hypothetical protein
MRRSQAVVRVAILLVVTLTGCSQPGGEASCTDFLKANIVDQEDIVDEALTQHGLGHDQMFDLTMVSQQVQHACLAGNEGMTVKDAIAWETWAPVLGK